MNVIIVGSGKVGFHIADRLSKEDRPVTIVEKSRDKAEHLKAKLNALHVRGSGPPQSFVVGPPGSVSRFADVHSEMPEDVIRAQCT